MKFSDTNSSNWEEWKPYMDTCLLPVTGLAGSELPWQAALALELLRDYMIEIERKFKGRIVTYPAFHYWGMPGAMPQLDRLCRQLREDAGFTYIVLMSAGEALSGLDKPEGADLLLLHADRSQKGNEAARIQEMWNSSAKK